MTRTVILGIDGLDSEFLTGNLRNLPTFHGIADGTGVQGVSSVFPPDSDTAWATLYTGQTPAQHGIVQFEDPLTKSIRLSTGTPSNATIRGRTFWDEAGKQGLRCGIVFPHLGYPAWPINGTMISRSPTGDGFTWTGRLPHGGLLTDLHHPLRSFPRRGREDAYLEEAFQRVRAEFTLFAELLESDDWDLFFAYSSTLDLLEHFFWPPANGADENGSATALMDAYAAYDSAVALVKRVLHPGDRLLILSDHGHGPRPPMEFRMIHYIESHLRPKTTGKSAASSSDAGRRGSLAGGLMELLLPLVDRLDIRNTTHQILRRIPSVGRVLATLTSPHDDTLASLAFGSPFKSYSYGGLRIRSGPSPTTVIRRRVRETIRLLAHARDGGGRPLLEWVAAREDVDEGPYLSRFPEVLFQLRESYAASSRLGGPFMTSYAGSQIVPGSHRRDTATFILNSAPQGLHDPKDLIGVHKVLRLLLRPEV